MDGYAFEDIIKNKMNIIHSINKHLNHDGYHNNHDGYHDNLFYFIQSATTRWILGTDDKFSAWNIMKDNAQRFINKELAENKLKTLNLSITTKIIKGVIPNKNNFNIKLRKGKHV